jgi:hypothetical protein
MFSAITGLSASEAARWLEVFGTDEAAVQAYYDDPDRLIRGRADAPPPCAPPPPPALEAAPEALASRGGSVSQFAVADGRSACSLIALEGVACLCTGGIAAGAGAANAALPSLPTAAELDACVRRGARAFAEHPLRGAAGSGAGGVEHLTGAEALLGSPAGLEVCGEAQGVLGPASAAPFAEVCARAEGMAAAAGRAVGCLLTKTPETVGLAFFPDGRAAVFDSHPRGHLGGSGGRCGSMQSVHAILFASSAALRQHLRRVFRFSDVADMGMAANLMLNSFDATFVRPAAGAVTRAAAAEGAGTAEAASTGTVAAGTAAAGTAAAGTAAAGTAAAETAAAETASLPVPAAGGPDPASLESVFDAFFETNAQLK